MYILRRKAAPKPIVQALDAQALVTQSFNQLVIYGYKVIKLSDYERGDNIRE